jgi:hypothetical protein
MRKSRRIEDLSLPDSLIRGITSEEYVEEALQQLEQAGRIIGYSRSDDSRDWLGIDFTVYFMEEDSVVDMPLQVKSSLVGMRVHYRKHSDIPCVVIDENDALTEVIAKVLISLNLEHPLVDQLSEQLFSSLTYQSN